ncbi:hypothetical protein [Actinomadura coerulea]|uniref:hypothetical protein n=1 Tax=Actinomadura coerulea TaxID=46159 RepID=UPI00342F357A
MQNKTTGWVAGAILLLIIGGTGKTGLPESGSTPGGSNAPAVPTSPGNGRGQVTSRLYQGDHWKLFFRDGDIDLPPGVGGNCDRGSFYPECKE